MMSSWSGRLLILVFFMSPQLLSASKYQPLQPLIDSAEDGATLIIPPGTYAGPVTISSPIVLDGQDRVTIDADGKGSVIVLDTDGATIRNLHLTNSGESHNDIDSGVQVRGNFNVIQDNVIDNALFGVDLQQSESNIVRRNRISSKPLELGQRGDAIRMWYSFNNKVTDNIVVDSRDTVVWYSEGNEILRNTSTNSRYSLHFMYSRYNLVEDNRYYNNAVGIFLMYSDSVVVRNNYIAHAAGPTGVGIGFKETSDLTIEGNEVLHCATGIYLDISPFQPDTTNRFTGNLFAYNGIGVRFLNDWRGNIFKQNRFVDNLTQVMVSSGRTANNNVWQGNYWSDYEGFDQDRDGVGDSPYQLYSYADRLWQDEPYAQFFKGSPMLEVLDFLERLAPFTEPNLLVQDDMPSSVADIQVVMQQEPVQEKDSLMLLRESLGR
jgi:nitrous oxidase accessory protein